MTERNSEAFKICEALSADKIREALPNNLSDIEIYIYDQLDSTNNEARRMLAGGFDKMAIVLANEQTAGRGRQGRSFFSPADTGLYMSLILHPNTDFINTVHIMTTAAVAVARAIENLAKAEPVIKWVNDVYVGERKVCGILAEGVAEPQSGAIRSVVLGIGINVTTASYPDDIAKIAGSVTSGAVDRNVLAASVAAQYFRAINDHESTLMEYKKRSMVLGHEIICYINNQAVEAKALDIDEHGGLVVQLSDGTVTTLSSGEISVRFNDTAK